jgi:hypothetical protein
LGSLQKHAPEILTGIGVAGVAVTAFLAAKATLKCSEIIKEENLTPKEKIGEVWKDYIPTVVSGCASMTCIVAGNRIQAKRSAALAMAAELSAAALAQYKAKAIETLGEKAEEKIVDAVAKQKIEDNPVSTSEIVVTGRGKHRVYDAITGRYFEHDIEGIRKIINDLNVRLRNEMYISYNELCYELDLPTIQLGDQIGWCIENGGIDVTFSSQICDDGVPCLVMEFIIWPGPNYRN